MPERVDEGLQLSHFIALTRPCVHAGSTDGPLVAVGMTPHVPQLLMLMLRQILQLCRNLSPASVAGRSSCSPILAQQHACCTAGVHLQQRVRKQQRLCTKAEPYACVHCHACQAIIDRCCTLTIL